MTNLNGDDPRSMLRSQRAKEANPGMPEILPSDHEVMKEYLRPGIKKFCDNLLEMVAQGDRTGMNLFPRIMGAIGAEREVNINLATKQAFGMLADEVAQIIAAHRQSSATSIEACQDDGVALLAWVIEQEPARRADILKALGGVNGRQIGDGTANGEAVYGG